MLFMGVINSRFNTGKEIDNVRDRGKSPYARGTLNDRGEGCLPLNIIHDDVGGGFAAPRVFALSPIDDQRLAGLVMFGLGNIIYFIAISIIFFGLDDKAATAGDEATEPAPTGARMGA